MNRWTATLRRGALPGLALLFVLPCNADESLRDSVRKDLADTNYVLVEEPGGETRLFVFSADDSSPGMTLRTAPPGSTEDALDKARSPHARTRVRGLTELAGDSSDEALSTALVLLSDPNEAVREEAVNLIIDHPRGDIDTAVRIAMSDPSPRVREAVEDMDDDRFDDEYGED